MKFSNTHILLAFIAGVIACKLLKKEGYAVKMPKILGKKEGFAKCSQCGI